jgi:hypothetical protein
MLFIGAKNVRILTKNNSIPFEENTTLTNIATEREWRKMKFTKVVTVDYEGKLGTYRIKRINKNYGNGIYSCTFINSVGDIETILVDEKQLHCE